MIQSYRFYRTSRLGDGLTPQTAFRSALTRYIVATGDGTDFWDWIHDARPVRYALARCDAATHAQIAVDPDCEGLSPEFSTLVEAQAWLDGPLTTSPVLATRVEADGCSTAWATSQTTRRDVFVYLRKLHVCTQDLRRLKNAESLQLFVQDLDTRISQLPAAVRATVSAWMQLKGLDISWISGQTTVRQVLHYVFENITWPRLTLGPLTV